MYICRLRPSLTAHSTSPASSAASDSPRLGPASRMAVAHKACHCTAADAVAAATPDADPYIALVGASAAGLA